MNPKHLLRRLWTTPPQELARRTRRRLAGAVGEDYSLAHILRTRHLDVNLLIDRWERTWRVVQRALGDAAPPPFVFRDQVVIELGCGPLFGYGPIAIHRGATRFYYAEPAIQRGVVESEEIRDRYFRKLHEDCIANYGDRGEDFETFHARVLDGCRPLEEADEATDFADLVLSSSVLEHIPRAVLPTVLSDLRRAARPEARYLHLVDFGAHREARPGLTQLETLYQQDFDVEKPGINYLRRSAIRAALQAADLSPTAEVSYRRDAVDQGRIHDSWRRFDTEDLESRVVIFLGG